MQTTEERVKKSKNFGSPVMTRHPKNTFHNIVSIVLRYFRDNSLKKIERE